MSKPTPSRIALVAAIGLGSTLVAGLARGRRNRSAHASSRVAPWQPLIDAGRRAAARRNDNPAIDLNEIDVDQDVVASENSLIDGSAVAPKSDA